MSNLFLWPINITDCLWTTTVGICVLGNGRYIMLVIGSMFELTFMVPLQSTDDSFCYYWPIIMRWGAIHLLQSSGCRMSWSNNARISFPSSGLATSPAFTALLLPKWQDGQVGMRLAFFAAFTVPLLYIYVLTSPSPQQRALWGLHLSFQKQRRPVIYCKDAKMLASLPITTLCTFPHVCVTDGKFSVRSARESAGVLGRGGRRRIPFSVTEAFNFSQIGECVRRFMGIDLMVLLNRPAIVQGSRNSFAAAMGVEILIPDGASVHLPLKPTDCEPLKGTFMMPGPALRPPHRDEAFLTQQTTKVHHRRSMVLFALSFLKMFSPENPRSPVNN